MTKYPIRELVSEVFIGSGLKDEVIKSHYLSRILPLTDKELPFEEFFSGEEYTLLKNLWADAFNAKSYNNYNRMYDKMSITKYISVHPRDIGKDKTFYFIGKRYTKVSDVKKIAQHYGWTWETKDPTKANFLILGDCPTWDEASINADLKLPVVMDDALRVDMHFLFNSEVVNTSLNEDTVASFLNSGNFEHFKLVVSMIQYLKEDIMSSENQFRLIRAYVNAFKNYSIYFDLRNKEHVWISDTVQRYCHPFHRSLVTNSYLTHRKTSNWYMNQFKGREKRPSVYSGNQHVSKTYNISRNLDFIHASEGESNVYKNDLIEGNRYSLVPAVKFARIDQYTKITTNRIRSNELYSINLYIHDFRNTVLYVTPKNGRLEIICMGLAREHYSSSTDISEPSDMYKFVDEVLWKENYNKKVKPLLVDILDTLEINSQYHIVHKNDDYLDLVLRYDELLLELKVYEDDDQKYEQELKFKRRKEAVSQL